MKTCLPIALAVLCACSAPAQSQQLYRCGNTYSQVPCAPGAASARISAGAAPDPVAASAGKDVCANEGVAQMNFPDPESTRIRSVTKVGSEVIQYAGQPIAVRKYRVTLNTKSEVGAYTGDRSYLCYLSEDERRVLKVDSWRP
jgi:hypothetical protein